MQDILQLRTVRGRVVPEGVRVRQPPDDHVGLHNHGDVQLDVVVVEAGRQLGVGAVHPHRDGDRQGVAVLHDGLDDGAEGDHAEAQHGVAEVALEHEVVLEGGRRAEDRVQLGAAVRDHLGLVAHMRGQLDIEGGLVRVLALVGDIHADLELLVAADQVLVAGADVVRDLQVGDADVVQPAVLVDGGGVGQGLVVLPGVNDGQEIILSSSHVIEHKAALRGRPRSRLVIYRISHLNFQRAQLVPDVGL